MSARSALNPLLHLHRGWNSWLAFGCRGDNMTGSLTAEIVTETADAIVSSGLKDKGYEYV
jgi:alpha-galactosidase